MLWNLIFRKEEDSTVLPVHFSYKIKLYRNSVPDEDTTEN